MPLIRWTPMRRMLSFRDEMDRLLEDFYGKSSTPAEVYEGDWCPSMDIKETDEGVSAALELPGLDKEDIKVTVKGDVLTISGEKKQDTTDDNENVHRVERSYGYFRRSVTLPAEVDSTKVKASFKDGVLKVNMPKVESKKVKEIPIQVS